MKCVLALALCCLGTLSVAQDTLPSIEEKVKGYELKRGLMNLYVDENRDSILMELPAPDENGSVGEFIYVEGLVGGLGSNDVGLDRGQIGETQLIELKVMGKRVMFQAKNLRFRAESGSAAERNAVRESFASSIIWSGKVVAKNDDGRRLLDITPFVVRDVHDVSTATQRFGKLSLDADRSAFQPADCLAFPKNLEFQAVLTFSVSSPSREIIETVPSAKSVTLIQHQSLIALPEPGYETRQFDPRSSSFGQIYSDYSAPIDRPLDIRLLSRFRLQKVDPSAARSKVVKPIIYYVDNAAPEPIRSALLDGARWWAAAFDDAGFEDAFKVEVLPQGVNPLDIRYNVIQWVHRSTRGWSYGGGVSDPRTGEILKGHVTLGSLRVRQDRLIFEGLLGTAKTGTGEADDPVQLSLARIRQLAAHELGHTLGFAHNFAGSSYGRASVMDYPAPMVRLDSSGDIDVSKSYTTGLGEWDKFAVAYAYTQFEPGSDVRASLDLMTREAISKGLLFLTDGDARPRGASHPLAALWDNGSDPLSELDEVMAVRRKALDNFGERNLATGQPMALLEETLVPIYFFHRYQVEAAAKMIGGYKYGFKVNGDNMSNGVPVEASRQKLALQKLLDTLQPSEMALPLSLLDKLAPRPFGYGVNAEMFQNRTGATFDELSAATANAEFILSFLLDPTRCARVVELNLRDSRLPTLSQIFKDSESAIFAPIEADRRMDAIRKSTQTVFVNQLIDLAENSDMPLVQAAAYAELSALRQLLATAPSKDPGFSRWLGEEIRRFQARPANAPRTKRQPIVPPPGMPIGMCDWDR